MCRLHAPALCGRTLHASKRNYNCEYLSCVILDPCSKCHQHRAVCGPWQARAYSATGGGVPRQMVLPVPYCPEPHPNKHRPVLHVIQ